MVQPAVLLMPPAGVPTGEKAENAACPAAAGLAERAIDLDLASRVELALRATGYGPLRGVEVTALGALVILTGQVPSYHLKQLAQATALTVLGAQRVRNELSVIRLN